MDDNSLISPPNSGGNNGLFPAIVGGLAALFVGAAAVGGTAALGARRRRHMTEGYILGQEDERADARRRTIESERTSAQTEISSRLARLERETTEEFRRLAEARAEEARNRVVEAEVARRLAVQKPAKKKKEEEDPKFEGPASTIADPAMAKLFTQMMGEMRAIQGRLERMEKGTGQKVS